MTLNRSVSQKKKKMLGAADAANKSLHLLYNRTLSVVQKEDMTLIDPN